MKRLEGKVAVVTGGNSGIGLASAKRLQEEGAHVVIVGRSQKTLDEAAKALGNGVLAIQADVSRLEDIDKIYAAVEKKYGKIDVLLKRRRGQVCPVFRDDRGYLQRQLLDQRQGRLFHHPKGDSLPQ